MFADLPMPPTTEVLGVFAVGSLVSTAAISVASFLLALRLTGRKIWAGILCVPVLCLTLVGLDFIGENLPPAPRPPRSDQFERKNVDFDPKHGTPINPRQ